MIVLDVEASGTDPRVHSVLSLGALDVDNPTNRFYGECQIWEGAKVEDEALAINGFTEEQITDPAKKTEAELVEDFIAWAENIEERTFAAQNVSFDHDFIQAACARAHLEFPFAKRTIDTHTLVWGHMVARAMTPPTENHHSGLNLSNALTYAGLPPEERPHNALTGALCHAELISRVAYSRSLLPEFEKYPIPWLPTA